MVTYMSKFFVEYFQMYRLLLLKIIEIKGTNIIQINHFDIIVRKCCPVTKEFFLLFAKVLMTSFLLIIMYLTLNELNFLDSENSFDLNTFLMFAFVLLTPGVLEIMFFERNADKVERMHCELVEQIGLIDDNTDADRQPADNVNIDSGVGFLSNKFIRHCCCGCLQSPYDEDGNCECCYTLEESVRRDGTREYTNTSFTLSDTQFHREEYNHIL
jgi:hypothetical protein